VNMKKDASVQSIEVYVDGQRIEGDIIKNIQAGVKYNVLVKLPL
jgi:cellobionic acid phosphorylase